MKKCFGLIGVPNIYLMYVYLYPMELRGFIAITLSVHLSVQSCPVRFFIMYKIGSSYITKRLPMTQGCVMILTQDHLGKFNVTWRKSAKFVSALYLFQGEKLNFFSTHQECYGLKVCHHLDHCYMGKFNVPGRKSVYPCLVHIFLWKIMRISYFTKRNVYDLRVCHDFVLRSRSLKKVY